MQFLGTSGRSLAEDRHSREHNLEEKEGSRKTQWKPIENELPGSLCSAQISWQVLTGNLHLGALIILLTLHQREHIAL